jgi:hypothetical protein
MTRRRLLIAAAVALVLASAGIATWLAFSLDGIVARAIERAGSRTTGTKVSVAGVSVHLKQASGTISSLRIANPKGFSGAAVLDADAITFDLDLATLRKPVLVVDEVVVTKPRLRFEVGRSGTNNLDVIARNAGAPGGSASPQKLRIKRFVIASGAIDADASAVQGRTDSLKLRDIVLTDVGGRDGGTSDEVAAEIVGAVRKEVVRAVAQEGYQRYLKGREGELKDRVKDRLRGIFGK